MLGGGSVNGKKEEKQLTLISLLLALVLLTGFYVWFLIRISLV